MDPNTSASADNDEVVFAFSVDDAKKSLSETGAYVVEDASAGHRVDEFIKAKQLPLRQVEGLHFCAQNSFYDKSLRKVIESSINRPHWGSAKIYNSEVIPSDTAYFFTEGPEIQAVFILLFTPDTRLVIFEGSHKEIIHGKVDSDFGLFTLPHDKLKIKGINRAEHNMVQGGFALIDGRVGWTILGGQQIAIGYASEDEIVYWGQIKLGDTARIRDKVAELNANGIKAKVTFVKPDNNTPPNF